MTGTKIVKFKSDRSEVGIPVEFSRALGWQFNDHLQVELVNKSLVITKINLQPSKVAKQLATPCEMCDGRGQVHDGFDEVGGGMWIQCPKCKGEKP